MYRPSVTNRYYKSSSEREMILVHTWEATEKFLSALLAPLKQNADLENMLKVTKWVETLAHPL